jgi:hypothetical protein
MTTLQAFLLGITVAWTPSLLLLGWFLFWRRFRNLEDQPNDETEQPAWKALAKQKYRLQALRRDPGRPSSKQHVIG